MSGLEITRSDARVAALRGLIDYAGLFPPESLDMESAVAGYRRARRHEYAWMVDRFICPVSRLEELATVLVPSMTKDESPWRLTVIADASPEDWDSGVEADAVHIEVFSAEMSGGADIEMVEKAVHPGGVRVEQVVDALRRLDRAVFFEVPWSDPDSTGMLETLARARSDSGRALGAKIRSGGTTADAFPPPEAVAAFIGACRVLDLPLKATAGLHHPFRHFDPETGLTHHGFINLLMASALAYEGAPVSLLAQVLADDEPSSFTLDRAGLAWKGTSVGATSIEAMRRDLFVGYGSCSFDEPVDDLTVLGVLPVGT